MLTFFSYDDDRLTLTTLHSAAFWFNLRGSFFKLLKAMAWKSFWLEICSSRVVRSTFTYQINVIPRLFDLPKKCKNTANPRFTGQESQHYFVL